MSEIDYDKMSKSDAVKYFNEHYNISYVNPDLPKPDAETIFKHYVSAGLIYGLGAMVLIFNPFYKTRFENVNLDFVSIIAFLYILYLILAPVFLFIFKPKTVYNSNAVAVLNYLLRIIKRENYKAKSAVEFLEWLKPNYKESQAMLLFFIKFFFAPQIIVWTIGHYNSCLATYKTIFEANSYFFIDGMLNFKSILVLYRSSVYLFLLNLLFFFDCLVFSIGYCSEIALFKNKIRSVESSFFGLFVCLMCYPPFNAVSGMLVGWSHNEDSFNTLTTDVTLTWILYLISLGLTFIYVSASIALFTKASNLTNRGTVSIFPYNLIRHPAYISKILLWCVGSFVVIKDFLVVGAFFKIILYIIGAIFWICVYYMRAITEERHLSLDPDYREYMKKVKYRFIPYVW